ncbi:MAG: hypothetical protein ACTHYV_07335 [Psychroflexus sp.]|uniref:hypothetical protein n=1 Tax=Psychroflexus sp. S27 TaxID=1982757 RepID=UPI000C2A3C81|nr:hypothetical protein [Psychroflexus sp. S27]PJX22884.1 hypothetical protein CAP47_07640 [Psychroflexus sp. S27]
MKKTLILISFVAFLASCKSVTKTLYGVKNPKIESIASTQKYLVKKGIDTTNTIIFKDLMSFAIASNTDLLAIPDAMFFNSNGEFVPYKESAESCNADVDSFLSDLKSINNKETNSSLTLNKLNSLLKHTNGKPLQINRDQEVYVFITWSKYAGRINKIKAFAWIDLIEKAKEENLKVKYYLVNCDLQESWEMTDEQIEGLTES